MSKLRLLLELSALIYITLYFPFTITIYSSEFQDIINPLKESENTIDARENLISYFLYKNELKEDIWSQKEIRHMQEVRTIYSILHIIAFISFILLLILSKKKIIKKTSLINSILLILIITLFSIIDFTYFWDNIFHQVLFDNLDWRYSIDEVSYILFPHDFFLKSIIFILISSFLMNLFLFLTSKNRPKLFSL